jgi:DNA-binding transcriptional regulator LsrR (DeoR family)
MQYCLAKTMTLGKLMPATLEADQLRMIARVARLYHSQSLRQTEIAQLLEVSQARVSRLLSAADELGIVKTIVMSPRGIHSELESRLEQAFGLHQVHVVESAAGRVAEPWDDLGRVVASVLEAMPLEDSTIGFTAWSRSLRAMAKFFGKYPKASPSNVVELLGDVGSPTVQHEATLATELFSRAIGGHSVFLRLPSVVSTPELASALVKNDRHAALALGLMDKLDVALVGIGSCDIASPQYTGANFFRSDQLEIPIRQGAVGQINLRFIDKDGNPVVSELDALVIGVTLEQLAKTPIRIGVAAGVDKWPAVKAAVLGQWINVLVTDLATAQFLAAGIHPTKN